MNVISIFRQSQTAYTDSIHRYSYSRSRGQLQGAGAQVEPQSKTTPKWHRQHMNNLIFSDKIWDYLVAVLGLNLHFSFSNLVYILGISLQDPTIRARMVSIGAGTPVGSTIRLIILWSSRKPLYLACLISTNLLFSKSLTISEISFALSFNFLLSFICSIL